MFFRRMFARKDSNSNASGSGSSGGGAGYDDNDDDDEGLSHNNNNNAQNHCNGHHSSNGDYASQRHRNEYRKFSAATAPAAAAVTASSSRQCGSATAQHRAATSSGPAPIQLTPLWEHILRKHALPDHVAPAAMFAEFLERLRDPEWQVRQHALRVFVDVLVVMRAKADTYMDALIPQLVENLGHPAPTVRKGALDCLRVYLAETAMPETVLLHILDIGLNQKITNEPFGGRLTCGVMLSLPALIQSTLHTPKRHYILRSAIESLVQKMGQVTHQEITLKVLSKIRELTGESEFMEYMSHSAYREFELLCNVYSVNEGKKSASNRYQQKHHKSDTASQLNGTWRLLAQQSAAQGCWRSSDEEQMFEHATKAKVIMETEIKINDDTLTMRILEAKDEDDTEADTDSSPRKSVDTCPNSLDDDEVVCGRLLSARGSHEGHNMCSVLRLLSDSEAEEEEQPSKAPQERTQTEYYSVVTPSTPSRTPKRVTFGGEVVKMRTPDSDANTNNPKAGNSNSSNFNDPDNKKAGDNNNNDDHTHFLAVNGLGSKENEANPGDVNLGTDIFILSASSTASSSSGAMTDNSSKTSALSLEITDDNTKPLPQSTVPRPTTASAQSPKRTMPQAPTTYSPVSTTIPSQPPHSPIRRRDSTLSNNSPRAPFMRLNISPVDNIISPKTPHKEIEVLHNLQRDPSPVRARSARRANAHINEMPLAAEQPTTAITTATAASNTTAAAGNVDGADKQQQPPKSWEDLGIVDYDTLLDLRSGNWRHRLEGITQLAQALQSSENLAEVQPCLASLLRTLLSSERQPDVIEAKRLLLINLISRLPLDNLEDRAAQIMTGLCRQGGAGANRVCKALMHRLPAAAIVLKLLSQEFLHAKSSRFRENALQMVMYALMTFPSTCFDSPTYVTQATYAALNRKRRVRQAALDVLAILGQMTTSRAVLEVVQGITDPRDEGPALLAAVRARLARKQVPLISSDGAVQYTLRVPSPHGTDQPQVANAPDVDWITAGVGSVSPGALQRRAHRRSFRCLPTQHVGDVSGDVNSIMGSACGNNYGKENGSNAMRRHSFRSPPDLYGNVREPPTVNNDEVQQCNFQHILGSSVPLHYSQVKKTNDYTNYRSRRMVAKSCSDSSMDGRSSDSTYTSSSGGGSGVGNNNGGATASQDPKAAKATNDSCTGISGRFTRQTVNSRFPAMDHLDLNSTYARIHKPPAYYPGMGAYAHLQQQQINMSSTYPKVNYTLPPAQQQRRRSQPHQPHQQQPHQQQPHQQQQYQQEPQPLQCQVPQQPQHLTAARHASHARCNANAPADFQEIKNSAKEQQSSGNHNSDGNTNLDGTYTISTGLPNGNDNTHTVEGNAAGKRQPQQQDTNATTRRFVNVEKFMMKSANPVHESRQAATDVQSETAQQDTPVSIKSYSYSQKSTASAQSTNSRNNSSSGTWHRPPTAAGPTNAAGDSTDNSSSSNGIQIGVLRSSSSGNDAAYDGAGDTPKKWSTPADILQLEEVEDLSRTNAIWAVQHEGGELVTLKKNGSLASLQSKEESIKTQLEDTPPILSRTQSTKSLVIEEDIEGNNSFVLYEHVSAVSETTAAPPLLQHQQENVYSGNVPSSSEGSPIKDTTTKHSATSNSNTRRAAPQTPPSPPQSRSRSPTIAQLKILSRRNSMIKSMESLYERPLSKQDSLDNTNTSTESGSQSSCLHNSVLPLKPQHTPLKQKSKTAHLFKSHRRVSPVKQAIKMSQPELYPPTMTRFEKPREALLKAFDQLDSTQWEDIILGLKAIVRLMRHHSDQLENQMHMVCIQLTRSARNLRSQVSRAACQAATELFTLKSKCLEQECDDLVCALLHRTADTNRFLRADATRALESMCDNLTPSKILNILTTKGALHQNALVRTTAAKLLHRLVERLGADKVFTMARENRDKFFITGANLLLEGSLETRSYAKSLFRILSTHHSFNRLLTEIIPTRTYRNVEKTLKSLRCV